jgi:hypothetical protein
VGRYKRGDALTENELPEYCHDGASVNRVKLGGGLVGDDELRPVGERTHDGDVLLFAS